MGGFRSGFVGFVFTAAVAIWCHSSWRTLVLAPPLLAAMAVAVAALWLACFLLTYTFPLLNAKLGASGTFWLYAGICVAGFVFIFFKLPETKNKSLEEIERDLVD